MKTLRIVLAIAFVAAMAALALATNAADLEKTTIFTFSSPVELPGVALPAGTYVFKVLDSGADRNVVQVFDKDQKHLFATVLTIPDYRPQPSDKAIVRFSETAAGAPPAVKVWFYPGDTSGWEFVYPKSRAMELAKASNQAVPSMPSELTPNITKPVSGSKDAPVKAMTSAPLKAQRPNGSETSIDESFSAKAPN